MVVIDSDVILLEYAFHRDPRQAANADFLSLVRSRDPATTIYNLMEILGQLSFNLRPAKLDLWPQWLKERLQLTILWPETKGLDAWAFFNHEIYTGPFMRMKTSRFAFLDSLTLNLAERTPDVTSFVTWNARHFRGKTTLPVQTPAEYLARI